MSRYATTPCNSCGAPIVFATARQPDGTAKPVPLDPSVAVYHRVADQDDEGRAAFWVEDQATNEYRQALARHRCDAVTPTEQLPSTAWFRELRQRKARQAQGKP